MSNINLINETECRNLNTKGGIKQELYQIDDSWYNIQKKFIIENAEHTIWNNWFANYRQENMVPTSYNIDDRPRLLCERVHVICHQVFCAGLSINSLISSYKIK